jgi:hypothetical protein
MSPATCWTCPSSRHSRTAHARRPRVQGGKGLDFGARGDRGAEHAPQGIQPHHDATLRRRATCSPACATLGGSTHQLRTAPHLELVRLWAEELSRVLVDRDRRDNEESVCYRGVQGERVAGGALLQRVALRAARKVDPAVHARDAPLVQTGDVLDGGQQRAVLHATGVWATKSKPLCAWHKRRGEGWGEGGREG